MAEYMGRSQDRLLQCLTEQNIDSSIITQVEGFKAQSYFFDSLLLYSVGRTDDADFETKLAEINQEHEKIRLISKDSAKYYMRAINDLPVCVHGLDQLRAVGDVMERTLTVFDSNITRKRWLGELIGLTFSSRIPFDLIRDCFLQILDLPENILQFADVLPGPTGANKIADAAYSSATKFDEELRALFIQNILFLMKVSRIRDDDDALIYFRVRNLMDLYGETIIKRRLSLEDIYDDYKSSVEGIYDVLDECILKDLKEDFASTDVGSFLNELYPSLKEDDQYWHQWCKDIDEVDKIASISKYPCILQIPSYEIIIEMHLHSVSISMNTFTHTSINPKARRSANSQHVPFEPSDEAKRKLPYYKVNFVLMGKDPTALYEVRKSGDQEKCIPLSVKWMSIYYRRNPATREFINAYLEHLGNTYMIMKDVKAVFAKDQLCLLPISINEATKYHNPKELFLSTYKTAIKYPIPWNSVGLNGAYMAFKAMPHIEMDSWPTACQTATIRRIDAMDTYCGRNNFHTGKEMGMLFIARYYIDRLGIAESSTEETIIIDWITMMYQRGRKITLKYRSMRRIREEHDRLAREADYYDIPKIKIPKNSRFNALSKLLPSNFERIKTRDRLFQEGNEQHNCVATYGRYINRDDCAIYSAIMGENRYTIEFRWKPERGYWIEQMYKSCNAPADEDDRRTVEGYLREKVNA